MKDPSNGGQADTLRLQKMSRDEVVSCAPEGAEGIMSLDDPQLYINREMSLLSFQKRVLEEGLDPTNPLLERIKFLSILGSNIDEFFMVRVPVLREQFAEGNKVISPDGMPPSAQLASIKQEINVLVRAARIYYHDELIPELARAGICLVEYASLSDTDKKLLSDYFVKNIYPVLTPLGFDPGHPFPHISGLSLNLAVQVKDKLGNERFARLKVPDSLPQLINISSLQKPDDPLSVKSEQRYVWLSDLIIGNLDPLFSGMEVVDAHCFHVTRDADFDIQDRDAEDLLEETQKSVRQRKFGDVVRLQVNQDMPTHILNLLVENLEMSGTDVYFVDGVIPLSILKHLAAIDRSDLKFAPFTRKSGPWTDNSTEEFFSVIRHNDVLLHHPYDSFDPVLNMLSHAATDPSVLAVKMTLYRAGKNSPVVKALLKAVETGKQVAVLVELKARFDEESNIQWAMALEAAGVHVIYGLPGLKVHCKATLVVRKEGDAIRRYVHLGTGNYNAITAKLYTDLGLFTCDEQIASDVTDLFNYLTGYSSEDNFKQLLVAPINLRSELEALILREIEHQKRDGSGRLIFKMNSLVDDKIIRLLYQASQAGVSIDLIVRGICCLRPGVPGVSENIRVRSIVNRFLEHSRIFYFNNGGNEEIFIGSADLMPRNLDRRVEALFPILKPQVRQYIKNDLLDLYLKDNVKARVMQADGSYTRPQLSADEAPVNSQQVLVERR